MQQPKVALENSERSERLNYKLTVDHDPDMENPCDGEYWKVISFNRRHINFVDPNALDVNELTEKVKAGLAFPLSYSEHGNCQWSLAGSGWSSDPFDSVAFAGILEFTSEYEASAESLKEMAENILENYTKWCNGSVYHCSLDLIEHETCPTCHHTAVAMVKTLYCSGNIYDIADAISDIKAETAFKEGDIIEVIGDAAWLIDKDAFKPATIGKK